jgi:hypothetical protein
MTRTAIAEIRRGLRRFYVAILIEPQMAQMGADTLWLEFHRFICVISGFIWVHRWNGCERLVSSEAWQI